MARILIVGGGCPGRRLAAQLVEHDHAVRITTRDERRRAEIEGGGAECWVGTPDRLATMRGALDHVTVACWMLAGARGERESLRALHGSRLEFFLTQAIDTTVRGFLYDATPRGARPDAVGRDVLADGAAIVTRLTGLNAIPAVVLAGEGVGEEREATAWLAAATGAIDDLLAGRVRSLVERG